MKKVKRLTAVILSALMAVSAFSALPVSAAEVESNTSAVSSDENFISGDYEYSLLDNGTVEISKYTGNDDDVTIPDTIDEKKVMSIGRNAFSSCKNLVSIKMSDNITSIGWGSFSACTNLKNVIISNTLQKATISISVINLLPHSILWIAFLSKSNPKSCNFSASCLWLHLGVKASLNSAILLPHTLFIFSFLFLNIFHTPLTFSACQ